MRRFVLPAAGRDLSAFRLEGFVGDWPVVASWDGHVLAVADELVALVVLARTVDSIYRDAGLEVANREFSITGCACLALQTLIELCDSLTCVEYASSTTTKKLV